MDDICKHTKITIWWSEEDNCWRSDTIGVAGGTLKTHGDTPEEALKNAKEVFELDNDKMERALEWAKNNPPQIKFKGSIYRDGKFWLAVIPIIDALTQGYTRKEACDMAVDLVENFINDEDFVATIQLNKDNTFEITGSDPQKMEELVLKRKIT
ncbi:MAG: hypothetical protein ACTSW7_01510 [Candidatus Thorarchaeota archaeon]